MDLRMIMDYIEIAGMEDIDQILNAVFNRRKSLFPEWDMVYFALPKGNREERKWMLEQALEVLMRE